MGFMPLNRGGDTTPNNEIDIPLAQVPTAGSTGNRRPLQSADTIMNTSSNTSEKKGLFHRKGPAGRRKNAKDREKELIKRRGTGDSEVAALNFMGKVYAKIVGFSVITRYLVYIVPVALILAVPIIVIYLVDGVGNKRVGNFNVDGPVDPQTNEPTKIPVLGPKLLTLMIWILVSWLLLWAGKVVAHLLAPIFMFLSGVVSSGTRKYAAVLRGLEIPVSLFIWALGSWLTFTFMIGQESVFGGGIIDFKAQMPWVGTMHKVLGALFVSSAVFLGEKAIVQLISITYHQRSFANRIQDSKREVHLLGLMYDASRALFPMYCEEFAEEDIIINDSIDMILAGRKGHKKSGSVTPMRLIGNVGAGVGRFGDKVTSVFGNLASEITGKQVFNPNSAHSIVVEALEKVRTSEALAKRIWLSFVVEGKDSLSQEDIDEVLGPALKEEAEECFSAIDADGNGDISLEEMIRKVVEIGKERKAIANSMKDIGEALKVFDNVLLFVVTLIVIFIFLVFFQSSFITTLTTAGTTLLSLSFIFAVTAQEFLGSCIFLFVKHPYDVGDRVDITGPEKEQLVVERISLLYTIFHRIDRMQVVQIPNIVLNNLWIENVTRSKAMKECIDVNVSFDTSFEDIELLRSEIEKFVRHPDNARDFQPDFSIGIGGVGDLDKLNLKVVMKHKSNWHNEAVRATRRSKFICALALALKKVPINAPGGGGEPLGGPTNPTYSVAVSDEIATAARDKVAKDKDDARMVPINTPPHDRSGSQAEPGSKEAEKAAAQHLNARDPALQAADGWGISVDDNTLNSREPSMDRNRAEDIESVRRQLSTRRQESQRGRRQAGQGLATMPSNDSTTMPSTAQLSRYQSTRSNQQYDVESQTGQGNPVGYGVNPYGSSTTTVVAGGRATTAQQGGYSAFPAPGTIPENSAAQFHPLQSSPQPGFTGNTGAPRPGGNGPPPNGGFGGSLQQQPPPRQ